MNQDFLVELELLLLLTLFFNFFIDFAVYFDSLVTMVTMLS